MQIFIYLKADALANIVMFLHNAGMFQLVTLPAVPGERATWTPIH